MFVNPSFYEGAMLVCFGISWPFAIWKTIKVKNPAGKSFLFAIMVIIGYVSGMIAKYMRGGVDTVFCLYVIDFMMVSTDLLLCCYYIQKNKPINNKIFSAR